MNSISRYTFLEATLVLWLLSAMLKLYSLFFMLITHNCLQDTIATNTWDELQGKGKSQI